MNAWVYICGVLLLGWIATTLLLVYACCCAAGRADDWTERITENEEHSTTRA